MNNRVILFLLALAFLPGLLVAQFTGEAALADKYYEEAEYEMALELYEKVHKKDPDEPHFIYRITGCYQNMLKYDEAIDFHDKHLKRRPKAYDVMVLRADMLDLAGRTKEADKYREELIYKKLSTRDDFAKTAHFMYSIRKMDLALETYLEGRRKLKPPHQFGLEISGLYIQTGEYATGIRELIGLYEKSIIPINRVKLDVLNLVGPSTSPVVEEVLIEAVQKNQKDQGIRTLIFDFYVMNEQFREAFIQVKSIDKLFRENGERMYQFALTMRNNEEYKLSNKALDFIIEEHKNSPYYFLAYKEKTVNNELQAFQTIPLDSSAIKDAITAYDDLLTQFGRKPAFFDAMYRKANLMAFYTAQLDEALSELNKVLDLPIKNIERAKAKLLMGDIYLMQKEYSKATLQYEQVADNYKDEQTGALAKFKQGRLSYYKGDFDFSQARLKSIKDNTSNDISNDAIQLSLLIQDNTGLDSTTVALQTFAAAQLLVFQREYDAAMAILDSMLYEFPNHSLTDEIYWEQAQIFLKQGQSDTALVLLDRIISDHKEDILADDALFTKARMYDYNFGKKEDAMQFYIQMLRDYPGSLFSVDVRKRIRELRSEAQ